MIRPIDEVCEGLLDEACMMWERDGGVLTTSFAIGHSRAIFVQPASEEACKINTHTRVRIQALIAANAGAVYLGRIDESLITERPLDSPPLNKGDLEKLAKSDPSIKTAIVVQATDTRTGESIVHVATCSIDDDGTLQWEHGIFNDAEGELIVEAQEASALASILTTPLTDSELREELGQLGWAIADSDEVYAERFEEDDE